MAKPPTVAPVDYDDAPPEVRAVYDDIMAVKGIGFVPSFWRTIAHHPPLLRRTWESLKQVMAAGALAREREVGFSAAGGNAARLVTERNEQLRYCIRCSIAAPKQRMSEAMLGPLFRAGRGCIQAAALVSATTSDYKRTL